MNVNLINKIGVRLSKTGFISNAIKEKIDLSPFKEKPSPRIITGISLIVFSYIIGWPLISLIGILSLAGKEPLIILIGGPVTYALSHAVFLLGMYLAGGYYSMIFLKWGARVITEKMINYRNSSGKINSVKN